jgi:shikimate kinase
MPIKRLLRPARRRGLSRPVEQEVIDQLDGQPGILLATGGGAVLRPSNRDALHSRTHVFYLRSTPEELHRRLRHDTHRPLLQVEDPLRRCASSTANATRCTAARRTLWWKRCGPSVPALLGMVLMQLELAGLVDPAGPVHRAAACGTAPLREARASHFSGAP